MIAGVLLAAGGATRFGGPHKLLAEVPFRGRSTPVVRVAAELLLTGPLANVFVVVGRDAAAVRAALQGLSVQIVVNDRHQSGMSSSLHAGVRAAMRSASPDGILIALGDQPLVHAGVIAAVAADFEALSPLVRTRSIVVARYAGVSGHPVVFGRELRRELLAVRGDRGARAVIECDPDRVRHVDFDGGPPVDVDVPDDLPRLAERVEACDGA